MFVVFPLVLHDGYMDITITKYNFFKNGVLIYGILMCLTFILGFTDHMEDIRMLQKNGKRQKFSGVGYLDGSLCAVRHTCMDHGR